MRLAIAAYLLLLVGVVAVAATPTSSPPVTPTSAPVCGTPVDPTVQELPACHRAASDPTTGDVAVQHRIAQHSCSPGDLWGPGALGDWLFILAAVPAVALVAYWRRR